MIKSMTGFGKGEAKGKFGIFIVEIRTVNHRYFDVSSRLPNSLNQFEDKIKNFLNRYIKRGKVNLSLTHRKNGKDFGSAKLDEIAIAKYYKMLDKINRRFKLKDDIKLSHILAFPDVIIEEQPEIDVAAMWPSLENAAKKAILSCNRMRQKEGRALYDDLTERIKNISGSMERISKLAPRLVPEYKNKLDSRIKDILGRADFSIDRSRLETELALYAKQCDVSEELTRMRSHIEALKSVLDSDDEAGRKLDFILQELQREVNTLGSKASDAKISRLVVDIKGEIEKVREQAQNVE